MKVRTMLIRKGLFTRLSTEGFGVNGHSESYLRVWRRVLDEMLLALIGPDVDESKIAYDWFNSKPGDIAFYIEDDGTEVEVDNYEEFCEVCLLAGLEPSLVTDVANKVFNKVQQEEKSSDTTKSN